MKTLRLKTELNEISFHESVSQFHDKYDLFLVDIWGVIHDGEELYDGVINCLSELKSKNKKIIFISNAPKRAAIAQEGLSNLGISKELYDTIITSGEITYDYIMSNNHSLGKKYFIYEEQDIDLLFMEGTEYIRVNSVNDADFMLAIGFNKAQPSLKELSTTLCISREDETPMICANPDLTIVDKKGNPSLCAGVMASEYEKIGGEVTYFGKPYHHVYERASALFPNVDKKKVCAIGDNIATDIKGGNNFNIDTYLIAGGIHGKELNVEHGQLPDNKKLDDFCDVHKNRPSGVLSSFNFK